MSSFKSMFAGIVLLIALVYPFTGVRSQVPGNQPTLLEDFSNPPASARPRVWWHWMDGNISTEGIKLDLDWMHRVGLGGVTIFEGANGTPQIVPHRLVFMTPEWKQAFNYAVIHARGLGMEVAIASSPGWSETGGPWVPAPQGMKKMVWSTMRIEGGRPFTGVLPHPPEVDGSFQNFQVEGRRTPDGNISPLPTFYADAAVVAYRIPDGDKTQSELNPRVTSSGGEANVAALSDGDVNTVALELPVVKAGSESWIQFDYGKPQDIRAATLASLDGKISVFDNYPDTILPRLEASDDGLRFRKIVDIPLSNTAESTVAFNAVTARYFRLVFTQPVTRIPSGIHKITELVLSSGARVNQFEERAGYGTARDYFAITDPKVASEFIVSPGDVIELTGKMTVDGTLRWTAPPGRWMVLRIGYSLTGHENGPAPAESTGLEVDKLNREFVKSYIDSYLKMYKDLVGPTMMGKDGISFLLTDSIEVGTQNWTDNMLSEFQKRRGYDARPWLPALTGIVIKGPADTDRFLWDFRRTIGQLLAENHYGEISEEMHKNGMSYYGEALEFHRPMLGDDMEMRSRTDVPTGAMWTFPRDGSPTPSYLADLRGAASVAHIYGQNLVGAESMTSGGPAWSWYPGNLRMIADLEFDLGVNRFLIHESTHEPLVNRAPGLTLGIAGQFFTRNETWAEEAGPWITYLARSSYLLQQGHFCADVAYFYGEEGPLTGLFGWKAQQDAPEGYGYDFVNSDVVLNRLSFANGRLVTPGGTSYRILYLGGRSGRMTLPVLRRLRDLIAQGAVVVGSRPLDSPSLSDDEKEFQMVADQLWGVKEISASTSMHEFGKGRVYVGKTAGEVLADLNEPKDFEYTRPEVDTAFLFVHRRLSDGDIYFVDNRKDRDETIQATFRVAGKTPELWDAVSGKATPVSYTIANDRTTIPLHLIPFESTFVVFRTPATALSQQLPEQRRITVSTLKDNLDLDWNVGFQPLRGAPETTHFDRLLSWPNSPNQGVKYFSGTAAYSKTIQAPASWFTPGTSLWLNLGDVENVAQVEVNGKSLGILWQAPYRVDLAGTLVPGKNVVTIKVTNLWVNRMIGDQQPNADWRYTNADILPYKANSPLLRSGMLGPLEIESVNRE
jgi:hypothetical protein